MNFEIRQAGDQDIAEIVRLSLVAWEPVFDSFKQVLGPGIFALIFPDWRAMQAETVETYSKAREDRTVWVAEVEGRIAGFAVCDLDRKEKTGEVALLAVHPDYQNRGIGTKLNEVALTHMKENGMRLAVVGTGGDPGHAPARRAYEKAGYTAMPAVRYYKEL